jgi:hypothetical protein
MYCQQMNKRLFIFRLLCYTCRNNNDFAFYDKYTNIKNKYKNIAQISPKIFSGELI